MATPMIITDYSPFVRSFVRSVGRSIGRSIGRSVVVVV
jgi:hypothetical protein